ncbi:hypothetical protein DPX16_6073 [Anabarilius grahami]|uniref:Uncharacterized protein n=1 Tax=Anabarilius grahami TaxID=495550 RepID=A0A3N0Z0W8_ANAGA|nr:hypothetical protein DPX16_6073 [Anabarilius grahami]
MSTECALIESVCPQQTRLGGAEPASDTLRGSAFYKNTRKMLILIEHGLRGDSLRRRPEREAGGSRAALEAAACESAGAAACESAGAAGVRRSQLVRCGASSTAGELVPDGEGFQLRRSARRNNVVAEGERSEILWRTARLYSHTPRPFWRALARCIAIGSHGSAAPSLVQKVLKFEPMAVQLHCAIEKGFSSGKKETFPHTQYE